MIISRLRRTLLQKSRSYDFRCVLKMQKSLNRSTLWHRTVNVTESKPVVYATQICLTFSSVSDKVWNMVPEGNYFVGNALKGVKQSIIEGGRVGSEL